MTSAPDMKSLGPVFRFEPRPWVRSRTCPAASGTGSASRFTYAMVKWPAIFVGLFVRGVGTQSTAAKVAGKETTASSLLGANIVSPSTLEELSDIYRTNDKMHLHLDMCRYIWKKCR